MENLYINISILLVSVLAYQIFVNIHKTVKRYSTLVLIILSAVAISLCMSFPIYDYHGHAFDLRFLPLLIGVIYGGKRVVFVLVIYSLINRFLIGGDGFYVHFLTLLSMSLFMFTLFIPIFQSLSIKMKLLSSVLMTFIYLSVELLICHIMFGTLARLDLSIIAINISTAMLLTGLLVYLMEYLKRANELMENDHIHDKFKGLSEMASSISHEVRNPLTVTKGFIQLVINDPSLDNNKEKRNSHLGLALEELERAEAIITDYLTYAKPYENVKLQTVNVIEELIEIKNIIAPLAKIHHVQVQFKYDANSDSFIKIDKKKFHQILINLMNNGIEAMPLGGILRIVVISKKQDVLIQISDNGVGMTEEEVARLGTPFLSTKEKGTGLGTMVAYQLLAALRGKITVTSRKGHGTTFFLTFKRVFPKITELPEQRIH
ncbi:sensor histidine kinase [Evansella tamaricis]|uniref:HAMP domain-containing histidine kinase n=1 Tax=Evansella tamaricis TaxID=2069301 RepID=A0ABS6JJN7_9BACI|nr:HAMP domain-containing sensor histidine kinase [Evansella tamaricis]MBU9713890.1 HAMP domain-containing histidine kinase [Evansella tamaricis]